MIGVLANPSEHAVIGEFFELFKTPWEFYRSGRDYEVLLCSTNEEFDHSTAKLVVLYSAQELPFDSEAKIEIAAQSSNSTLSYKGYRLPIYGKSIAFCEQGTDLLVNEQSGPAAILRRQSRHGVVARIGYNLFGEVHALLTAGQPADHAGIPTLELHIALLRELIGASGVSLVEIPPIPEGYQFIACLTHDIDHPSIRLHQWDHTILGFLYRAVFGSLGNFFRGRIPLRDLRANWAAALKLPLVCLGLAKDFWRDFDDRYLELEKGLRATFFVIPFKHYAGKNSDGPAPRFRAARYGARDIADTVAKIVDADCEVGLHGIDAWLDGSRGREELEEIRRLTGVQEIGVRMHWLCYDQQSPAVLDRAGASYDSTVGYKETVGYRSGTTQAYKPLQADRMLELPMQVMDTALFYPAYLGLSSREAAAHLRRFVDNAVQFGGCLTINWHDRSLAPERLWYACYRDLIADLKKRGAWFATAGQAAAWFRKRRSVVFESDDVEPNAVCATVTDQGRASVPRLQLRLYNGPRSYGTEPYSSEDCVDIAFDRQADSRVPNGASV